MAKEKLTREQQIEKQAQLTEEIKTLNAVIEASNTPVFDLLIKEIKKEMYNNIAEEDFKALKNNQKKIESYRSVEKIIQNQSDLLEDKQEELEDVEEQLKYYQASIFDLKPSNDVQPEDTGFKFSDTHPIETGDIFESDEGCMLIKKSQEIEGSFAMISDFFEGERCLQYPSNFVLLNNTNTDFIGNIFKDDTDSESVLKDCLTSIADYQDELKGIEKPEEEEKRHLDS